MNNKANASAPNVAVRARLITYYWDGHDLKGLLSLLGYGKTADERSSGPPHVAVNLDAWISADQAICALKKIIAQIEDEGLPSTDVKVTAEVAKELEQEGADE